MPRVQHILVAAQTYIKPSFYVSLQVSAALRQDFHFTSLFGDKWGLAVYKTLRWGLAGAGNIAADFAEVLALVPGAQLAAVAVRSQGRLPQAQAFADQHGMLTTSASRLHGKPDHRGLHMHPVVAACVCCWPKSSAIQCRLFSTRMGLSWTCLV